MKTDTSINDGFKNLKLFIYEAALSTENDDENAWFIEWFGEYYERTNETHMYLGDNRSHRIRGYRVICVNLPNGQMKQIHNVLYGLVIKKNLISVSSITNQNLNVEFMQSHCLAKDIQNHYKVIAIGTRIGELYKLM